MSKPQLSTVLATASFFSLASAGFSSTSVMITNPSFEADTFGTFPGYLGGSNPGAVTGWTTAGGGGINGDDIGAGSPFINGSVVDGHRAGFIQGSGAFSQTITGLVPGQTYRLNAAAIARNCCGDLPNVTVSIGSTTVVPGVTFPNTTWTPLSFNWVAGATSELLSVSSMPSAGGDASLGLDSVHILQLAPGEIPIFNPNFEMGTGIAFPGYASHIGGWSRAGSGNVGYNFAGNSPFADNGAYPEGGSVLFMQNTMTISQTLTGLTPGQKYLVDFYYNTRDSGDNATLVTSLNGTPIFSGEVVPVGGTNAWYQFSQEFTASASSVILGIGNAPAAGLTDATLLIDAVRIVPVPEPTSGLLGLVSLGLVARRRRS